MIRRIAWWTMALLALGVAGYAGSGLFVPAARTPFVASLFSNTPLAVAAHLAGGMIAIALGALQVNSRLRSRYLSGHRWVGRVYVLAVAVGGTAGLMLALNSYGGLVTHFGFGMMAVCWLFTTGNAYRHIRNGDTAQHRAWMLRSYALTLAAVSLRIYLPLSQVYGIEFSEAYPAIAWLCWVPNLLIVEWFILGRKPHFSK